MDFELKKIKLELKKDWNLSRNSSSFKENFILSRGEYSSEIAPNIRYQEDSKLIESHFKELLKSKKMQLHWCSSFQSAVNNILLKEQFQGDLSKALGVETPQVVETSFSIPIMDIKEVEEYLKLNSKYQIYKLKVSDHSSIDLLKTVANLTPKPIRVDANEGFTSLDDYLKFENEIQNFNIQFVEQPFPTHAQELYKRLKPQSRFEIIADESVLLDFNGEKFQSMFHGVNIKIMKSRGVEEAKRLILKAKDNGLKAMIGCMIETSLGISEAIYLAGLCDYIDLDGSLLIKDDPYRHLIKVNGGKISLA